jgi:hypothetical protein
MDHIAAIPDEARRKHLLRSVPCRVVPTHGAIYGVSTYGMARYTSEPVARDIAELERRNKVQDALIGVTAKWDGATLVTEDGKFARDASALRIAVLRWPQFTARLK